MFEKTIDVESFDDLVERLEYTTKIAEAQIDLASRNLAKIERRLIQWTVSSTSKNNNTKEI